MATKKTRKRTPKTAPAKKAVPKKRAVKKAASKDPTSKKPAATQTDDAVAAVAAAPAAVASNKSEFIRAQPASMSAKEVVEAAKNEGIEVRVEFVHNVRHAAGIKGPTRPGRPRKDASAAARPGRDGGENKSDFIRAQPTSSSAKEVVAKGAEQGLIFGETLVYNVRRAAAGTRATKKAAKKEPAKRGPGRPQKVAVRATGDEVAFRELVVKLGTERAKALVVEMEAGLRAVIAGT